MSFSYSNQFNSPNLFNPIQTNPSRSLVNAPTFQVSNESNSNHLILTSHSISIPMKLASPPLFPQVNLQTLIVDDELETSPVSTQNIISSMIRCGPELFRIAREDNLVETVLNRYEIPPYLSTTTSLGHQILARASHILAIRSTNTGEVILQPIHGILFASISPVLSILSSRVEKQPLHSNLPYSLPIEVTYPINVGINKLALFLPVVKLDVPSIRAFVLLETYIYTRSSTGLIQSLLPIPPPPFGVDSVYTLPTMVKPSPTALSFLSIQMLLESIQLIFDLWQIVIQLEIGENLAIGYEQDPGTQIWRVMRYAWIKVVHGLVLKREQTLVNPCVNFEFPSF